MNSYTLHCQQLEHITTAKYLGVSITSDMKWNQHISNICKKANNTMSFLKRNLNIRHANINIIYKSFRFHLVSSIIQIRIERRV